MGMPPPGSMGGMGGSPTYGAAPYGNVSVGAMPPQFPPYSGQPSYGGAPSYNGGYGGGSPGGQYNAQPRPPAMPYYY